MRYKTIRDSIVDGFKAPFIRAVNLLRGQAYGASDLNQIIWALKDISLEVKHGEAVGIIGRNGAGKTTMLKVISRITEPSGGCADIYGRVGSLLEVGTGFHPELTGRDNIYLNGAILGMSKREIAQKFDEIVDFSGVEKFIDTPVKHYSSGMYMRLAFAVAAHLEPEILLVDEVLAVGDAAFQKKCIGKMNNVVGQGRTILLVSHNMEAVLSLCSKVFWLNNGSIEASGSAEEVVRKYLFSFAERGSWRTEISQRTDRLGEEGVLRFTGFHLQDTKGNPIDCVATGDSVDFVFSYTSKKEKLANVSVWFWIRDNFGRGLLCLWTDLTGQDFQSLPPKGEFICRVPRFPLKPDKYTIDINSNVNGVTADRLTDAAVFEVVVGDFFGTGRSLEGLGTFIYEHSWRFSET